ncbi:DJ-1/PfpI family protein [Microbispora sp. H10949]|uniref:DJ-1/PfpI family protein n=1 Tax=Microbispora sp. H10949 TaxID=2729111 RepID=UPI0037C92AB2
MRGRLLPGRAGPIAALCHGPLVLAAAGVLKGRERSAYPACALDVEIGGSTWVDSEVHVDQNLVTGRAWPDHPAWMRRLEHRVRPRTNRVGQIEPPGRVRPCCWWRSPTRCRARSARRVIAR